MIRINLLPHREERRKARRQQFFALLGALVVFSGVVWGMGFSLINSEISSQQTRNEYLQKEIDLLKKDIDEISRLKEQTDALLKRKQVIESLQTNRAETLRMFDELLRRVPDGIRLTSLNQSGINLDASGESISEARVSTLMRNLEESSIFQRVSTLEIKSGTNSSGRPIFLFQIKMQIERQAPATNDGKSKVATTKGAR